MRVAVYVLHSILIEELVDVNTICGAVMVSVIMEKIAIIALLIVHIPAKQLNLLVEISNATVMKIVHHVLKTVEHALLQLNFVAIISVIMVKIVLVVLLIVVDVLHVVMGIVLIKAVKIVQLALKIVVLVLSLYVAMVTVIFTSTKIVQPVLVIVVYVL
jgi:hypothetical protein